LKKLAEAERAANPSGGPPMSDGLFGPPLTSINVTSPYGWRFHPILAYTKLHTGVDLGASCGTPIYATGDGTVIVANYQNAWGNRTEISHGMIGGHLVVSSYNHQSKFAVSQGQTVTKGQLIGYVGTTGLSTGCHLHYEVLLDGEYTDPMSYM
jgi:murein DD-endopeptidase MepM/ murein hydrolase activator NlpD